MPCPGQRSLHLRRQPHCGLIAIWNANSEAPTGWKGYLGSSPFAGSVQVKDKLAVVGEVARQHKVKDGPSLQGERWHRC